MASKKVVKIALSLLATLAFAGTLSPAAVRADVRAPQESARTPFPLLFSAQPATGIDEATRRAGELQQQVEDLEAESDAIEARVKSTTARIWRQQATLEQARRQEAAAHEAFEQRVVRMYETGDSAPLALILTAPSLQAALDRGRFLIDVVSADREVLENATKASSDAAYQAQRLDELRARDIQLRELQDQRVEAMRAALGRQQQIVAQLNDQQRRYVEAKAAYDAAMKARWEQSSFVGTDAPKAEAFVDKYPSLPYLVDNGEPTAYASTGILSTELTSWYSNADNAPDPTTTASGRLFNDREFTCATVMRDPSDPTRLMPFGTRLALTRGDRRIIVTVTDRGPYIAPRTIDVSKAAAEALGFDGVEPVNVEIVVPK